MQGTIGCHSTIRSFPAPLQPVGLWLEGSHCCRCCNIGLWLFVFAIYGFCVVFVHLLVAVLLALAERPLIVFLFFFLSAAIAVCACFINTLFFGFFLLTASELFLVLSLLLPFPLPSPFSRFSGLAFRFCTGFPLVYEGNQFIYRSSIYNELVVRLFYLL